MKNYDVTLSVVYNGHTRIRANSQEDAVRKAEEFAGHYTIKSIPIDVMPPTVLNVSTGGLRVVSVVEILEWTSAKEDKLFEAVYKGGGFVKLGKPLTVTVTEDDVKQQITLQSLVIIHDNGNNLKGITDDHEMWDLLDYLNDQDLCRVYDAVISQ